MPTARLPPLVLASASPRRAGLLRAAGIGFDVAVADIDEVVRDGEGPSDYVQRLARDKARAVAVQHPDRAVLGADTTVVLAGEPLGKPADAADAARMLRRLSGRRHDVLTGVCLLTPNPTGRPGPHEWVRVATTGVWFGTLAEDEIAWYVESGEPMDKAGAYGIQGLASRFVRGIDGSYSNVVGLPVALVYALCREAGIQVS